MQDHDPKTQQHTLPTIDPHLHAIYLSKEWVSRIIATRGKTDRIEGFLPPIVFPLFTEKMMANAAIREFVEEESLSNYEFAILAFALVAEVSPDTIKGLYASYQSKAEIGLLEGGLPGEIRMTIATISFMLAGEHIPTSNAVRSCFSPDAPLIRQNVIRIEPVKDSSRLTAFTFSITKEFFHRFTTGENYRPRFSHEFPAKRIQNRLEWRDLVLAPGAPATGQRNPALASNTKTPSCTTGTWAASSNRATPPSSTGRPARARP
jgi:hypothetical protein